MAFRMRHLLQSEAEIEQFRVVIYGFSASPFANVFLVRDVFLHEKYLQAIQKSQQTNSSRSCLTRFTFANLSSSGQTSLMINPGRQTLFESVLTIFYVK